MKCFILTTALLSSVAVLQAADGLTQGERDRAMSELHATRKLFLDSIADLSDAQWNFKPSPERWSIAQCAEHIAISEEFIFGIVPNLLKSPAVDKKPDQAAKDEFLLKGVVDRTNKFQAPEPIQPKSRWASKDELIAAFKKSRDEHIAYVRDTTDDLRAHIAPHPAAGPLDAYQWILLMSAHSERHTMQINEVKADPNYPK